MEVNIKPILNELKIIKEQLTMIKNQMPDKEMFLTAEEAEFLKQSYENEKKGKLTSSGDLRKELGI